MSFTVTIAGHTDDANAEHDLFNALQAVVSNAEFGVTAASGDFQFAGQVDLLPPAPPPAPAPTVDELLANVAGDVAAIADDDPGKAKLLADFNELAGVVHANESASSEPSSTVSDTPPSDTAAPEAPPIDDGKPVTDHTGTPVAL